MSKVYIANSFGGEYEDSWQHAEKAFLDKNKAEEYKQLYELQLEAMQMDNEIMRKRMELACEECKEILDSDFNCYNKCGFYYEYDYMIDEECGCSIIEVELVE